MADTGYMKLLSTSASEALKYGTFSFLDLDLPHWTNFIKTLFKLSFYFLRHDLKKPSLASNLLCSLR